MDICFCLEIWKKKKRTRKSPGLSQAWVNITCQQTMMTPPASLKLDGFLDPPNSVPKEVSLKNRLSVSNSPRTCTYLFNQYFRATNTFALAYILKYQLTSMRHWWSILLKYHWLKKRNNSKLRRFEVILTRDVNL